MGPGKLHLADILGMNTLRQYDDPFEQLLAEIIAEIVEEMIRSQPQDKK